MVDREMLSAISDLLDKKLEEKLEEKLDQKLDQKLEKLEQRLEQKLEEKLEQKLDEKLDQKFDEKLAPINEKFERIDKKFEQIDKRFERIDERFERIDERFDRIEADVKDLKQTTSKLTDDMRYVKVVLLENNVIPRLNTIESCYVEASRRYLERANQIDAMQADIDILKSTVEKHSDLLQKIS